MWKKRIIALLILIIGVALGYFVYASQVKATSQAAHVPVPAWFPSKPFKLGLDLSGGVHLIYKADISALPQTEVDDAMQSLRDVIERRINIFGVAEPVVQVQKPSFTSGGEERLIVDLPGITDISQAITMIGQTPLLQFKTERPDGPEKTKLVKEYETYVKAVQAGEHPVPVEDPYYVLTDLTGRYLSKASLDFSQTTGEPIVSLTFNDEGAKLFETITKENIGKTVAIYLDGAPISAPVVRDAISGGQAQISGNFTPKDAKQLVGRLNSGALPVPIELISTQTIGPSLGERAVQAGMMAGMIGFLIVALFLILWYRLPGFIASIALAAYVVIILSLYKIIPVTLTAAGIAGFIISIGIAVDANVLIFERIKEELRAGRSVPDAIETGFARAWSSIRDSNLSTLITALILFWFGTSLIKGFALTLGIGVIVSMFSAIVMTRIFLKAMGFEAASRITSFLFGSGFSNSRASK